MVRGFLNKLNKSRVKNHNEGNVSRRKSRKENPGVFDSAKLEKDIQNRLKKGEIKEKHAQILKQRMPVMHAVELSKTQDCSSCKGIYQDRDPGI